MTKARWFSLVAAAVLGMTAGSLVNAGQAQAAETLYKQCFYYPPHQPSCEQCGPELCFGAGFRCCFIL